MASKKPWGGRFAVPTDQLMEKFSASIGYDRRLYPYDIQGSIAHCKMLAKCKILSAAESKQIIGGLEKIRREFETGKFVIDESLEDIHMNIEKRLIDLVGPVGGKLHTGRSRNDQVCLDARLFLRHETGEVIAHLTALAKALLAQAKKTVDHIIPGYTHLQRAQPVRLAHHLLAHLEMILRDRDRFQDNLKRINVLPLGSAAMAGTNFPLDRHYTAKLLKFPEVSNNSLDAVSDRDFMIEFCANASILMMHLSRFCEELVLWSTSEFRFVQLSDAFTTGSSIMPQKKNPDAAELIRGKSGRVYGHLMGLLTLMKSLPLSYNRDMQEDKEGLFDTVDTIKMSLAVFTGMLRTAKFLKIPKKDLEAHGFLTATDLADYLAMHGMPFRQAHEVTGKTVAYCESLGITLSQMSLEELQRFWPGFKEDALDFLNIEKSADRKRVHGGTAKQRVQEQIERLSKLLSKKAF